MSFSDQEREEAVQLAKEIIGRKSRRKSRRVSINRNDIDGFWLLWGMFMSADEATDGTWMSEEDRKKISGLRQKILGTQ